MGYRDPTVRVRRRCSVRFVETETYEFMTDGTDLVAVSMRFRLASQSAMDRAYGPPFEGGHKPIVLRRCRPQQGRQRGRKVHEDRLDMRVLNPVRQAPDEAGLAWGDRRLEGRLVHQFISVAARRCRRMRALVGAVYAVSASNATREWADVRVDVEVDEGWNVGWNERWSVGWNLETVAMPHEYGCGRRNGMRGRTLISAVALTLLAPAPGL